MFSQGSKGQARFVHGARLRLLQQGRPLFGRICVSVLGQVWLLVQFWDVLSLILAVLTRDYSIPLMFPTKDC